MDSLDYQIIEYLAEDGRIPFSQIAERVGKSTATIHQRARRLREQGYIDSISADLNWEALGYPVDASVSIRDNESRGLEILAESLSAIPFVISAEAVTGEFDLMLNVKARSSSHLGVVLDEIRRIAPGPSRTVVTLNTYISGRIPPLPAPDTPNSSS
ncbi:MAG: Lrp/AsnC family transcriptional regulator [Acidimicrobiia bacterium]|nr:Lrp/AsnC family transcriptional regulator [Acidimicrobiia bacterium]